MPTYRYLQNVLNAARGRDLVLFLGAGVSANYGLPNWSDLAIDLFLQDAGIGDALSRKARRGIMSWIGGTFQYSPESLTRFLVARDDSLETIRQVLYAEPDEPENMPLDPLTAIAEFIARSERNEDDYGVRAVLTSNFDDLLEQKLRALGLEPAIEYEPKEHYGKTLPIIHIHGYLPQKGDIPRQRHFIFNEADYHRRQETTYAWPDTELLYYMQHSNILFIGCSMMDPHLRELLDHAQNTLPGVRHYAFRPLVPQDDDAISAAVQQIRQAIRGSDRKDAPEGVINEYTVRQLVVRILEYETKIFEQFGVRIIPIRSFYEIANFFALLKYQLPV